MRFGLTPLLVAAAISASAVPALAQPDTRVSTIRELRGSGASYEVAFDDDPLGAFDGRTHLFRIQVRPGPLRVLLIRPRTNFVPQMLKSVEQM